AWETAHGGDYALRGFGYRQELRRRRPGRASAGRGGALLGQAGQRARLDGPAGEAAAAERPEAGRVLRGGALWVWALSPAEREAGRDLQARSLDWLISLRGLTMFDAVVREAAPEYVAARENSAVSSLAFWLRVSSGKSTV